MAMQILLRVIVRATFIASATSSYAQTICVFDPLGLSGDIDPRYWEDVPAKIVPSYYQLMRNMRLLLAKSNVYSPKMLHILKNVRCHENPNNFDCALNDE